MQRYCWSATPGRPLRDIGPHGAIRFCTRSRRSGRGYCGGIQAGRSRLKGRLCNVNTSVPSAVGSPSTRTHSPWTRSHAVSAISRRASAAARAGLMRVGSGHVELPNSCDPIACQHRQGKIFR
jgi:hypothetical protein